MITRKRFLPAFPDVPQKPELHQNLINRPCLTCLACAEPVALNKADTVYGPAKGTTACVKLNGQLMMILKINVL